MIKLYLREKSPARKTILETIPQPRHGEIEEIFPLKKQEIPSRADLVIHCGSASPDRVAEFFAAQKGTFIVCLPEAMDWVQGKLDGLPDVVIIDAALAKLTAIQ